MRVNINIGTRCMCREDRRGNSQVCGAAVGPKGRGRHVTSVSQRHATSIHRATDATAATEEAGQHGGASCLQVTQRHQAGSE